MSVIDTLKALAITVRNEKKKEANSAIRIGDLFLAIIDFIKGITSGQIRQEGVDTYNDNSGGKTSLLNTYSNPEIGWSVLVRKDETNGGKATLYQWNGSRWINLETVVYNDDVATKEELNYKADITNTDGTVVRSIDGTIDTSEIVTYELKSLAAQSVLFSKMVRAVYTEGLRLKAGQNLRIVYFGLGSPNFQSYPFGVQIGLVENGVISKQTNYVYQYNTDLKNDAKLQLTSIGGGVLATEGLKVYVVLSSQYESLVANSFDSTVIDLTQASYNWYLHPLLGNYIQNSQNTQSTDLIDKIQAANTGGFTYQVRRQHVNADVFKTYIGEVYITGVNNRVNRKFRVVYFGTKHGAFNNAPIGLQISVRKQDDSGWENAANYFLSETLTAGQTYRMSTTDSVALSGVTVCVKLASTYVTPTAVNLYSIDSVIELTALSWNNFIPLPIRLALENRVTEITVSANEADTDAQFKGANAIQLALNSITDVSATNRYRIYVKCGLYKITNSSQFIGYQGYPTMIVPKDHVDIIGQSKEDCIVWAELPYNDSKIDTNISRFLHQTIYSWADDCTIENITFVSKNLRYTNHQDNPNEADKSRIYKNVEFRCTGDKSWDNALGIGTYSGSKTFVNGGKSQAFTHPPVAIHNNQNFKKPSEWHFKNHEFINSKGDQAGFIYMSVCGSLVSDKLELIGCSFGSSYVFNYADNWIYTPNKNDSFNHAEWRIMGYGNAPFYFNNTVKGLSLRIDAKEGYMNVKIDTTSTAYASLLKNPHSYFGHLGHPERYVSGGHIIFDSYQATKGYVIGGLSIYEGNYTNGTTQSADGLGKRLGDCSTVNKELKLTIGNDAVTVTFDKNYTNMSNADIIAEINTALGTHAVASEYNISLDYYPEMSDVMSVCVNGTKNIIPKGTPLTQFDEFVIPAKEGDKLFGIALDDFVPFSFYQGTIRGYGRVLKRGYISTVNTNRHLVKVDSQSNSYKVGNGTLTADANGSIKTIADGIVGVNI